MRARKGVLKVSKVGGGCRSIKEARRGSALRRWRMAVSTSPSQERDRAMIRGTTARALC